MKYTRDESNAVIEVKGCTTCPHMTKQQDPGSGADYMQCNIGENFEKRKKRLIGNWTGAYHESCKLPSKAQPFNP